MSFFDWAYLVQCVVVIGFGIWGLYVTFRDNHKKG